jgi:hypothetical protein
MLLESFNLINSQANLGKLSDDLLIYFITKQWYIETASMDMFTSTNDLHNLTMTFTSDLFLGYILCQKMIAQNIEEDYIED